MNTVKWRDQQLIKKLQLGDRQIQQELYDDFAPIFYSSICRLVKDQFAREMILQQVFVNIFKNLGSVYFNTEYLFSWMFGILQKELVAWHEGVCVD